MRIGIFPCLWVRKSLRVVFLQVFCEMRFITRCYICVMGDGEIVREWVNKILYRNCGVKIPCKMLILIVVCLYFVMWAW